MTAAREQILAALRERIVAYAASRLGRDTAEDLAQEVLMLIETKYGHVESMDELVPLSFQILRFKMNDLIRKRQRRGEFNPVSVDDLQLRDGSADPYDAYRQRQMRERLTAA